MFKRFVLTILSLWSSMLFAEDKYPFSSKTQLAQFEHLTTELRCMVCRHQNLAESDAPLAMDMKQMIYEKVVAGESDSDIRQFLIARYGDVISFKPPFKLMTWFLWLAPILFLAFGIWVFIKNTLVVEQ